MTDTPPPPTVSPGMPPHVPSGAALGKPRSMGLVIFLSIITLGVWTIVWSYQNGKELKEHNHIGLGGVLYVVLTIVLAPITMFLMAGEVEKMYRADGKEPPITMIWGLWFLLPLIGNIIWYVRMQRSLNDFWMSHGAGAATGV
jgi:Domain of unknown function (DUF4234)